MAKLVAWETGTARPSLRQAEKLAKLYDRPFSIFALPAPPVLPALATEYRRLPKVTPGEESPELRLAVRRLIQRRRIAQHLYTELGDEPVDFPLRAALRADPEELGAEIRESLQIPIDRQLAWASEFVAYRQWREAVERLGVLVCQFPGKNVDEIRGTAIVHFPLPVIGINSKEIPLSKPFTLVHELVHLALAASAEEKPAQTEDRDDQAWGEVERFCEATASAVLMPKTTILADPDVLVQQRRGEWDVPCMRRTARRFRVTPTAVATRLLWLRVIKPSTYAAWKESWAAYRAANPELKGFGLATPAEKAVGRSGPLFTSLVLSALSNDRITSTDASSFLDVGRAAQGLVCPANRLRGWRRVIMYSVDTNIYLDWWERRYPTDIFPTIKDKVEALISAGKWAAVARVSEEINHNGTTLLKAWANTHKRQFIAHDAALLAEANAITQKCPGLIDLYARHDEADRYVIALAKLKGWTVVSRSGLWRRCRL